MAVKKTMNNLLNPIGLIYFVGFEFIAIGIDGMYMSDAHWIIRI